MNDLNKKLIDQYQQCKNVAQAARQVGMNTLSAYKVLAMSGALTMSDRCSIGTRSSQLGAKAELEFQRLVPTAKLQNCDEYQRKDFDFLLENGMSVDVKSSRISAQNNAYTFRLQRHYQECKNADFYVLFALIGEAMTDGYTIYVVPTQIADDIKVISFMTKTKQNHWIADYEMMPEELSAFFDFSEPKPNQWSVLSGQATISDVVIGKSSIYIDGRAR